MSDSNIGYVSFEFFKQFHNLEHNINSIELHMSNPFHANKTIINIAKKINTPLFLYTWINNYKNIYDDIQKTKAIIYLTLFLIVLTSCFNIASISLITVSKKTKEIAILRSMGANNFLIQIIFLYYGIRSIIIGSFIGFFLAIITILNLKNIILFLEQYFQDNIFLNNIYYNNFLLLKINLLDVILVFVITIIIGIITNFYPAYYASKINPSEILKEH